MVGFSLLPIIIMTTINEPQEKETNKWIKIYQSHHKDAVTDLGEGPEGSGPPPYFW